MATIVPGIFVLMQLILIIIEAKTNYEPNNMTVLIFNLMIASLVIAALK